jgi:lipopolysaccharide transport system ATP-binding protein
MSHEIAIEIASLWKLYRLQRTGDAPRGAAAAMKAGIVETLDDVAVREGKAFWALRDINLVLNRGEAVGVIGRNGAGKSTLLKILSRVTGPTRGRARIHGSIASLLEVGTGFHDDLTGRENIFLNATILGMSTAEVNRQFDAIVEFSGVKEFIDVPVKHLSSGMRVRLGFSVAVHVYSEILIVDEVLAVGDAEYQDRCRERVAEIVGAKDRTVLVVSHSMRDIESLCARVVLMDHGAIVAEGAPDDIIPQYLAQVRHSPVLQEPAESSHGTTPAFPPSSGPPRGSESEDRATSGRKAVAAREPALPAIEPIRDEDNLWKLSRRADRTGDGRLQFTAMALIDSAEQRVESIGAGEAVTIEIDYAAQDEILGRRQCSLSLAVNNEHGDHVFWVPSRIVAGEELNIQKAGKFTCTIPELPLLPGTYFIDCWVSIAGSLRDRVNRAAVLKVHPTKFHPSGKFPPSTHGDILVRYSWSDREKPAVSAPKAAPA